MAILIPFPYFASIFTPIMHFQWDSKGLLLYPPGVSTSLGGGNALHRALSSSKMTQLVNNYST